MAALTIPVNDFFKSGLETEATLTVAGVSVPVKVHYHEKPPEDVLKNYDVSGSQPVIITRKTDFLSAELNDSASNITVDGTSYLFVSRQPYAVGMYLFELGE